MYLTARGCRREGRGCSDRRRRNSGLGPEWTEPGCWRGGAAEREREGQIVPGLTNGWF